MVGNKFIKLVSVEDEYSFIAAGDDIFFFNFDANKLGDNFCWSVMVAVNPDNFHAFR